MQSNVFWYPEPLLINSNDEKHSRTLLTVLTSICCDVYETSIRGRFERSLGLRIHKESWANKHVDESRSLFSIELQHILSASHHTLKGTEVLWTKLHTILHICGPRASILQWCKDALPCKVWCIYTMEKHCTPFGSTLDCRILCGPDRLVQQ